MSKPIYYWDRRPDAIPNYQPTLSVWDMTNQELNAMERCGRMDDFGNEFLLYSSSWNVRNYFLVQRADDPGIFHYREEPNAGNLQS